MKKIINKCCNCHIPAYKCLGENCPLKVSERYYCDTCGNEEKLYHFDGQELCINCIEKLLKEVI